MEQMVSGDFTRGNVSGFNSWRVHDSGLDSIFSFSAVCWKPAAYQLLLYLARQAGKYTIIRIKFVQIRTYHTYKFVVRVS